MSMNRRVVAGLGLVFAAAGMVWACGPDFPMQLLDYRDETLKATPKSGFRWEAKHLLPATDALRLKETPYDYGEELPPATEAALLGLTVDQMNRVNRLRGSASGEAAYAAGADLPEDLRLYTAGAVDFDRARGQCPPGQAVPGPESDADPLVDCSIPKPGVMDAALASFQKVLELPAEQATLRSVWAAYMVGRIHTERAAGHPADVTAFKRDRAAAGKAFQLARNRAVAGASDTQGLAVASFGEEARLYLHSGERLCSWSDLKSGVGHCGDGIAPADLKRAIALYSAQAGHGSDSGVNSLEAIAGNVLQNPDRAQGIIDGPVSQRLLVAYATAYLSRDPSRFADENNSGDVWPSRLKSLVDAIVQKGPDQIAGADRVAALAYRIGQYDVAAGLVEGAQGAKGPMASWIRAKLALQKGDLDTATAAYAEAAKAFPLEDDPTLVMRPDNVELISGEQGVLALARGEYVEAMRFLFDAAKASGGNGDYYFEEGSGNRGYASDVSYLAERVLTLDELKTFIDAYAPASTPSAADDDAEPQYNRPFVENLRWVLARRLMREGRYDDAQSYLPAVKGSRSDEVDLRAKAAEYAKAIRDAESAWTDIGKAEHLFAAAVIAREHGMELLGYEQGPDHAESSGMLPEGGGHSAESLQQDFVTEGERKRFAATAPTRPWRFHYRYVASDLAVAAADLVPPRSQAFAATLCAATGWMRQGPPDYSDRWTNDGDTPRLPEAQRREQAYYHRYVAEGPYVPWAVNFGKYCEQPDFDRARELQKHERIVKLKRFIRQNLLFGIGGLVLVLGGGIGWWLRRRNGAGKVPDASP